MYKKREIRFRVWNAREKRMYNPLVVGLLPPKCELPFSISSDGLYVHPDSAESEGFVLMQSTGVKDDKGRDIYEGDIVRLSLCDVSQISQVYWEADGFVVDCDEVDPECALILVGDALLVMDRVEVIGNVYEHPELLEEAEKHG